MTDQTCALHSVHHPSVAVYHTIEVAGRFVTVCPTGAANFRAAYDFLTGTRSTVGRVGKATWDLAQEQYDHVAEKR